MARKRYLSLFRDVGLCLLFKASKEVTAVERRSKPAMYFAFVLVIFGKWHAKMESFNDQ